MFAKIDTDTMESVEGEKYDISKNQHILPASFRKFSASKPVGNAHNKPPPPPPPRSRSKSYTIPTVKLSKPSRKIHRKTASVITESEYNEEIHENKLIHTMIHEAMSFHSDIKKKDKLWTKGECDKQIGIGSWYKIGDDGYCYLRSAMHFDDKLKYHSIFDYYDYLECGTNNDDKYIWDNKTETNVIKIFDNSHQFMYSKAEQPNAALKLFGFSPREMYYIATRFKEKLNYKGVDVDIVGSLNYSDISNKYKYESKNENVTVNIKYRGILLIQNNEYEKNDSFKWKTKAVYVSCFNPNIKILDYIKKQYLKGKALEIMKKFNDSWMHKMECLEKRKMALKQYTTIGGNTPFKPSNDDEKEKELKQYNTHYTEGDALKIWLNNNKLSEYYDILIENGFENISDLNDYVTDQHLFEMGIKKIGHRARLLNAIKKL